MTYTAAYMLLVLIIALFIVLSVGAYVQAESKDIVKAHKARREAERKEELQREGQQMRFWGR